MKRPLQVTLLVLSGLGLLHASLFTNLSLRFVKEGMRPMLVASGVLLLVLGVAEAWSTRSRSAATPPTVTVTVTVTTKTTTTATTTPPCPVSPGCSSSPR